MQVTGAAAAGADREASGDMGVGARGEGCDLFVADVHPLDSAAPANGVGKAVEAVAHDAVDALHTRRGENFNHLVGDGLSHRIPLDRRRGSATINETGRRAKGRGGFTARTRGSSESGC